MSYKKKIGGFFVKENLLGSSIFHSLCFSNDTNTYLVTGKSKEIEIYKEKNRILQKEFSFSISGRITCLKPLSKNKEIFIVTIEKQSFFVIQIDVLKKQSVILGKGNVGEFMRCSENGHMICTNTEKEIGVLLLAQGLLSLVYIEDSLVKSFSIETDHLNIFSICFSIEENILHLNVLNEECSEEITKTKYTIDFKEEKFVFSNRDPADGCYLMESSSLGVLLFKNNTISCVDWFVEFEEMCILHSISFEQNFLLCDILGNLYCLSLEEKKISFIATVEKTSSISYLGKSLFFFGSQFDSFFVDLTNGKCKQKKINYTHPPIVDFCCYKRKTKDFFEKKETVFCCGIDKQNSLKKIQKTLELSVCKRIEIFPEEFYIFGNRIAFSYENKTEFYLIKENSFLKENFPFKCQQEGTIGIWILNQKEFVHVTSNKVFIIKKEGFSIKDEWNSETEIISVTYNKEYFIIGMSNKDGGCLLLFSANGPLAPICKLQLQTEPHLLHLNKKTLFFSKWNSFTIFVCSIEENQFLLKEEDSIELNQFPCSISSNNKILLIGLKNGEIFFYKYKKKKRNTLHIGNHPVQLSKIKNKMIFVVSKQAYCLKIENTILPLFIDEKAEDFYLAEQVTSNLIVCRDCFGVSLRIIKGIKQEEKVVPLSCGTAKRISYQKEKSLFGIISEEITDIQSSFNQTFLLIMNSSFEKEEAIFEFERNETAQCISSGKIGDKKEILFAVGFSNGSEKGGFFLFEYQKKTNKLLKRNKTETKGAIYDIGVIGKKIIVGINEFVKVYSLKKDVLEEVQSVYGQILTTNISVKKEILLIGDLMRSVSVFKHEKGVFIETGRDYSFCRITAQEIIDDKNFLCGDENGNLLWTIIEDDFDNEESRGFYLGERINVIRKGSLMQETWRNKSFIRRCFIFGTVAGSIGTIIQLNRKEYELLFLAQECVCEFFEQSIEWREFYDKNRKLLYDGFIDGRIVSRISEIPQEALSCLISKRNNSFSLIKKITKLLKKIETC